MCICGQDCQGAQRAVCVCMCGVRVVAQLAQAEPKGPLVVLAAGLYCLLCTAHAVVLHTCCVLPQCLYCKAEPVRAPLAWRRNCTAFPVPHMLLYCTHADVLRTVLVLQGSPCESTVGPGGSTVLLAPYPTRAGLHHKRASWCYWFASELSVLQLCFSSLAQRTYPAAGGIQTQACTHDAAISAGVVCCAMPSGLCNLHHDHTACVCSFAFQYIQCKLHAIKEESGWSMRCARHRVFWCGGDVATHRIQTLHTLNHDGVILPSAPRHL